MQRRQHSYWQKFRRARLSRRRFLGGAVATGLGAAGLAAAGCAEEEEEERAVAPTPKTTPAAYEPCTTPGGWTRAFGWDPISLDTHDPHQTQFGPMYTMHAAVFSKVLNYEDDVNQVMYPDLSADPDGNPAMPEQVDEETYIIRVRPTARFQDTPEIRKNFPELAGRPVSAEDIKYSIERQVNPESPQRALYYRRGQWETVDKIELIDDLTLRITTKGPIAPFLHYLSDRNAAIVPREVVDENDEMNHASRMVGSGPFILEELKSVQHVKCRRNPEWFAADDLADEMGSGRPFLDGYLVLFPPESPQMEETAFKTKQIDSSGFGFDYATLARVRDQMADQTVFSVLVGSSGAVNSRLLLDRPPFDDFRRRKALHLAIDRQILGEQLFPSVPEIVHWKVNGPIAWPAKLWAIPQEELVKMPGYRFGTAEREEDLAEARKLWEAAGGLEAVSKFKIIFAGVPGNIPQKALPQMVRMLSEVLGVQVDTEVDATGYTTIAACMLRNTEGAPTGTCEMVFGYDNGWIDLDDWIYPYFHTGAAKNSFRLSDPKLDDMLEAQRVEFDFEKRQQIGLDIQYYLLDEVLAQLPYISEWDRNLRWNYLRNTKVGTWTWHGMGHWYANMWLDHNDPTWAGRSA